MKIRSPWPIIYFSPKKYQSPRDQILNKPQPSGFLVILSKRFSAVMTRQRRWCHPAPRSSGQENWINKELNFLTFLFSASTFIHNENEHSAFSPWYLLSFLPTCRGKNCSTLNFSAQDDRFQNHFFTVHRLLTERMAPLPLTQRSSQARSRG